MSFEPTLPPYNAGDPLATYVNVSCLDFLFAELVPSMQHLVTDLEKRRPESQQLSTEKSRQDAVRLRLETLGYRVGQGLAERFTRDKGRFTDHLDVIKFLCKDLWTLLFRKQIDNLKTNHRGVYVLSDSTFYPFRRMSTRSPAESVQQAQAYLWFPSGVIRGALLSLGIDAVVHAETSELPAATFQIKTQAGKGS